MVYEEHFDELAGLAYQTAYRILGSRPDAEEVTQEAMTRALLRWRRIGPHARAWVCRVAANEAIGVIRSRRRRERITSMHIATEAQRRHRSDAHDAGVDRLDLQQALLTLPRRQREVLVLRYLADMTEAEVAAALSISVGTVKTHAHRALAAMRGVMPPNGTNGAESNRATPTSRTPPTATTRVERTCPPDEIAPPITTGAPNTKATDDAPTPR